MNGLLLFAHGARDPRWARPFEAIAQRIAAQQPHWQVRLAFLEFMEPGFDEAVEHLLADGCVVVHVLPMFLGSGGHVQRDLPGLIAAAQTRHADSIRWHLHPPLGEMPRLIEAMADCCIAAAQGDTPA